MTKSAKVILLIILASFLARGIFLVAVFPIFKGQDESRHYNTVQYLATGKDKDCQNESYLENGRKIFVKPVQDKQDLSTYRYSGEIRETALVAQHKQIRGNYYDKINFTNSNDGYQEAEFKNKKYSKTQHICPPDIATSSLGKDGFSLYQWGVMNIERLLISQNIFIRYDVLRTISVLLGVVTLLLGYNVFRTVEFTKKQSLILTAIISFQPKLVTYFTNINYDVLLIPLWTGFILVGVVIIKKGWNFRKAALLLALLSGAIMTKPSALPLLGLVVFLAGGTLHEKFKNKKNNWVIIGGVILAGGFSSYILLDKAGVISIFSAEYMGVLAEYLSKSLPKIYGSSRDYWGAIGWSKNNLTLWYVKLIWSIELTAWLGISLLISSTAFSNLFKKTISKLQWKFFRKLIIGHREEKGTSRGFWATTVDNIIRKSKKYLNRIDIIIRQNSRQKIYLWFMLTAIIVLQVGIRVADWKIFTSSGSLDLGTPGRYWLPNIVPHFVLLGIGLKIVTGLLVERKIKDRYFEWSLLLFLVVMVLYWSYEVINIIIPRFYL
jgi:hypothetical protein